jgi:anti-sigma regulatory factor (Ser/Thr protein kinase)
VLGGELNVQTTHGLLDLMVWTSERLLAAELTGDGVVTRANAALLARGPTLVGQPIHAIVTPSHRAPLDAALRGATAGWSNLEVGLFPDEHEVPAEHRVWISGSAERILFVAEPVEIEQDRAIDALLTLSDRLVHAHEAERALERVERERARGRRLLQGWTRLSAPALSAVDGDALVDHALDAACDAVESDALLVLHAPDAAGPARVLAARGIEPPAEVRTAGPESSAGRLGLGDVRVADDLLTVRLVSPHIAAAGARRLALLTVPGLPDTTVHVGWSRRDAGEDDELALLEHAAAVMADGIGGRIGVGAPAVAPGELRVGRDLDAPGAVRRWLGGLLEDADDDTRRTALLLGSELVTNAVRHSTAPGGLHVVSRPMRGGLRVSVSDPGGSPWTHERRSERAGFGLMLVDAMSSRWGIERAGGTTVWFELPASAASRRPASDRDARARPRAVPRVSERGAG